jgi:hypothetical protein
MKTLEKAKTAKKMSKPVKYLRLPVDLKTQMYIDRVKKQNPYFSDVDVVFYMMGKYIVNNNFANKSANSRIGEILEEVNPNPSNLSEDETFQILKDNNLM